MVNTSGIFAAVSAVISIYFALLAWKNRGRSNIVKNLSLNEYRIEPTDPSKLVYIAGQKAGILASIMAIFGFGLFCKIRLTSRFVVIESANKTDEDSISLAVPKIVGVAYGFVRERYNLYLGLVFIAMGLFTPQFFYYHNPYSSENVSAFPAGFALMLLGAGIIYFLFIRRRVIEVRVTPGDGQWYGYSFVSMGAGTIEKARDTALIIQKLVYTNVAQPNADPVL